jgi:MSHA biogenesis protein MshN
MSVINKMLQDLDKRHAAPNSAAPGGPNSGDMAQQVRPVKSSVIGSNLFWRVMAGLMVVVVAWVGWVLWQVMPRSVVTDRAYQSFAQLRAAPQPPAPVALAAAVSEPAAAPLAPAPAAPQPASMGTPAGKPAAPPEPAKIDMLRMATEIVTPIGGRHASTASTASNARSVKPARSTDKETIASLKPGARAVAAAPDPGSIDKRVDITPRERAESEFRRAMTHVNQGRMAEGMDGLRATLVADPAYEPARQTLVALLLETKRTDEAAGLLQAGLAINPANTGYTMLLARIYVERGDPSRALALLQKSEAAAQTNAEYHAFVAALHQRLGRHAEAVEQYLGALRLTPGVGAWWVGLGISQEALSRQRDATESFQRAKGTGNLNAELLAYVERRLQQLQ